MKSIIKSGDNLGGLLKIWAVPKTAYSLNGTTVTFSDTSEIYEIYCTPETMECREPDENLEAGKFPVISVSGFVPKDTKATLDAVNDMDLKPYVIIFRDGNGSFKLAGTYLEPLRLTANRYSGKNVSDPSGWEIKFTGQSRTRSVFIDNPF